MILIEVGFRCNNTCVFCAQGDLASTATRSDVDGIAARIEGLVRPGVDVAFVGGEPTLVPDLPDLVRRARERGAESILVQTNARRLMAKGAARELAVAGVTGLDVSLHGSNEAAHDYHTGVEGSFGQTVLGLRRARAAGLPFGATVVVTRWNFRHLAELVRVVHSLGGRAVHFTTARPFGRAADCAARVLPSADMVRPHLSRGIQLARTFGLEVVTNAAASSEEARRWFAGIGTVQGVTAVDQRVRSSPRGSGNDGAVAGAPMTNGLQAMVR